MYTYMYIQILAWRAFSTSVSIHLCTHIHTCIYVCKGTHTHSLTHTYTCTNIYVQALWQMHRCCGWYRNFTETATPPKSSKSRNSNFLVSCGSNSNWNFGLNLYRGIWVCGLGRFRGCSILSGICDSMPCTWCRCRGDRVSSEEWCVEYPNCASTRRVTGCFYGYTHGWCM